MNKIELAKTTAKMSVLVDLASYPAREVRQIAVSRIADYKTLVKVRDTSTYNDVVQLARRKIDEMGPEAKPVTSCGGEAARLISCGFYKEQPLREAAWQDAYINMLTDMGFKHPDYKIKTMAADCTGVSCGECWAQASAAGVSTYKGVCPQCGASIPCGMNACECGFAFKLCSRIDGGGSFITSIGYIRSHAVEPTREVKVEEPKDTKYAAECTDGARLDFLSNSADASVRHLVAKNPATSEDTLKFLSRDTRAPRQPRPRRGRAARRIAELELTTTIKEPTKGEKPMRDTAISQVTDTLVAKNKEIIGQEMERQAGRAALELVLDLPAFKVLPESIRDALKTPIGKYILANTLVSISVLYNGPQRGKLDVITDSILRGAVSDVGDSLDITKNLDELISKFGARFPSAEDKK